MPALSAVEGSAVALGEARIWEKPGFRFAGQPPRSPVTTRILATTAFRTKPLRGGRCRVATIDATASGQNI
jgi:hypothetical protein